MPEKKKTMLKVFHRFLDESGDTNKTIHAVSYTGCLNDY